MAAVVRVVVVDLSLSTCVAPKSYDQGQVLPSEFKTRLGRLDRAAPSHPRLVVCVAAGWRPSTFVFVRGGQVGWHPGRESLPMLPRPHGLRRDGVPLCAHCGRPPAM